MSLFVCDAMCRDRFHWHVTNWCRCCCRCMHMRAVVAELCSRQALVASRAVTEIRQIYGRCPLDMARMVLVSVAVVAICCPLSLEWKWKFSWTVWTTWMKLVVFHLFWSWASWACSASSDELFCSPWEPADQRNVHHKDRANDEWILNESYPRLYLGVLSHLL
jgi:hypothetical protein